MSTVVVPNLTIVLRSNTMKSFIQRYAAEVMGVLNGFDRVRIRGTLRFLCYPEGLGKHLSTRGVLLKDFKGYVQRITTRLREAIGQRLERSGRPPVRYLDRSTISKEEVARQIAQRDKVEQGLIAVLSSVELCRSFEVGWDAGKRHLELRSAPRKCLHYYHYLMHPQWGHCHVRLQSWFPFTVYVCLNGREWLARQMDRAGLAYLRQENCFTWIADVDQAQRLMDQQLRVNWKRVLDRLVPQVHPLFDELFTDCPTGYYWSVDESEWASDVMFRSPEALAGLYPRLIRHGMEHLGSREVMRFLGRRVPAQGGVNGHFGGEVSTDLRRRPEGLRIKHRLNRNSIKMYDKQGSVLRVETSVYDSSDLRVYRRREGDWGGPMAWRILRKAVADIHRRAEVCQAANERYLESMATVSSTTPLGELAENLCRPARWNGQRVRALNPLAGEDAALLEAVSRGEFSIQGFRNRDLRAVLYGAEPNDPQEHRRQSAAITRKLRLLRGHGLIHKVARTHRYHLSPTGKTAITALLAARAADTEKLTAAA
jgi:hypothetical protein